MDSTALTRLWSGNSVDGLLRVARDIESQSSWRAYLNVYEHEIFKYAVEKGGDTWQKLIDGKIPRLAVENATLSSGTPSSNGNGAANNLSHNGTALADHSPKLSSTPHPNNERSGTPNQQQQAPEATPAPSTFTFDAHALSLKIRYMLYDKSISILYPSLGGNQEIDFSILEDEKIQQIPAIKSAPQREADDDYDDDDDDDADDDKTVGNEKMDEITNGNTQMDDTDEIEVKVDLSTAEDDAKKTKEVTARFNRLYHIFEGDREAAAKQRKLEESDRQVDNDMAVNEKANPARASLGAANLSLKHLLAQIESKRDDLSLTDVELRNLISDVRKNRSKWYNEQRIGQEELYEACEKVVMELRGYTEHSTAFLTKVNKRDAPNYFNIIKKPMDLNTVMKKLKALAYTTKKEFVDDLNLIWDNCLTYNTDPKHFLRGHAIAMRKKMQTLTPLIPDITVRDRSEVEAEEREAGNNESDEEGAGARTSRVGAGKGGAKKGRKRKLEEEEEDKEGEPEEVKNPPVPVPTGPVPDALPPHLKKEMSVAPDERAMTPLSRAASLNFGTPRGMGTPSAMGEFEDQSDAENEDEQDVSRQVWLNVYSKQRSKYARSRGDLFKDNKLQPDGQAPMRRIVKMNKFEDALKDGKNEEEESGFRFGRGAFSRSGGLLESLELEKEPYIMEYEVTSGLPETSWSLNSENVDDGMGGIEADDIRPSDYVQRSVLNTMYNGNLRDMQEIRKICSKIALIRQMQQQTYMHSVAIKPYVLEEIKDEDLDLESRLPNRDRYDSKAAFAALRRTVGKISMHTGFEVTEVMAVDALTEITADFIQKLGRTLVGLTEQNVPNDKYNWESMVNMTLEQNGIDGVNSLDFYVQNEVGKQGAKLTDLKEKLQTFLGDLLRPVAEGIDDASFKDNSDQFLNGDFSDAIGEDFFGFKELGLDKELGLLTSSVPLHLLHSRLSANLNSTSALPDNEVRNISVEEYKPMDRAFAEKQIGLLVDFYKSRFSTSGCVSADGILLEGDQLPSKQRNSRPKVPPTGKIASAKKKPLAKVFFRPPKPVVETAKVAGKTLPGKSVAGKTVPGKSVAGKSSVAGKRVPGKTLPGTAATKNDALFGDTDEADAQLDMDDGIESLF